MRMKTNSPHPFSALSLAVCLAAAAGTASFAAQFKFPTQTFTVPDGFVVELVAGPPLIDRPIEVDFDEQGRLYATESSGTNDKVTKQLEDRPHRVLRLEDTDGDGKFDKSSVFADKLMFPEGCLWHGGSLYVSAPPSIWKLTDTDGDGVADKREEWWKGGTLTGCANDLHGPYPGPDGFIYWTKGAFAEQTHTLGNGRKLNDRAAHIYRARPDGSELDVVMTGGMDNPVAVAFTREGETVFSSTFIDFSQPGYRDGIAHGVYGGVFGKQNDVLEDGRVRRSSPDLMHPFFQAGNAAECGLCSYESTVFGRDYQNNLFATSFNLRKVTRHVLRLNGATYASTDSDFLTSDNPDFHPTDVLEDADGSLLVVDTGGWYKICCPTSQLWKPDVLGAIYRVRRADAPRMTDPRGLKLDWSRMSAGEMVRLLEDPRPGVRQRAMNTLPSRREQALSALAAAVRGNSSPELRRNAIWTLARIDGEGSREIVRALLDDRDASVRQIALRFTALRRDAGATGKLIQILDSAAPESRRAAAEALGRIGNVAAAAPLLRAVSAASGDSFLEHSLIYALIEIGNAAATLPGLESTHPRTQRAALIALDQMEGHPLPPGKTAPFLVTADPALRQTASWIVSHHPEWGAALAEFFTRQLADPRDAAELGRQLAQLGRSEAIQELLATTLLDSKAANPARLVALDAMTHASPKEAPSRWAEAITAALQHNDPAVVRHGVAAARTLPAPKQGGPALTAALLKLAHDPKTGADMRLDALAAVPGGLSEVDGDTFRFLTENLEGSRPVMTRSAAAGVLAKARLDGGQLLALATALRTAGPLEVSRLLVAFDRAATEPLGLRMLESLRESKALSSLRAETLKPHLTNFPETVQRAGEQLLAMLNTDAAKQKAHLDEITAALHDGDIRRGQTIFNGPKAACSSCHAIGYLGGKIGPDLTRIGQSRTERDLLEAVVYPSASFVRSYEPMIVATRDGEEFSGVLRKDAPDEIILATGPETEARIARAQVAEMRPGNISMMPQGLDEQLTRQELADLMAFLKATRW
jgi:putative membrane-bound dehydrogenase-like protein